MSTPQDITGERRGKLVAVRPDGSTRDGRAWIFRCDCGGQKRTSVRRFRAGHAKSCGCLVMELAKTLADRTIRTHGEGHSNKTPEYRAWSNMKERCSNPRRDNYSQYGGRGIQVCDRWRASYQAFLLDMGRRPSSSHSLDRINVNGDYEPTNCRWSTAREQQGNRRTTLFIEINGERLRAIDVARAIGVPRSTLYAWLKVERLIREKYHAAV